jgi:hypothetical protein
LGAATIHSGLAEWVRVSAGVQNPVTAMAGGGRFSIEGDVVLAARLEGDIRRGVTPSSPDPNRRGATGFADERASEQGPRSRSLRTTCERLADSGMGVLGRPLASRWLSHKAPMASLEPF